MSKKKEKPVYKNIEFDSKEEIEFFMWCEEAKEAGIISDFKYHPHTYVLFEKALKKVEKITISPVKKIKKIKLVDRVLLDQRVYTPDFWVYGATKGIFEQEQNYIKTIDVKGKGSARGGEDRFLANQKWLYQKHDVYAERIVPLYFFTKTWRPKSAGLTKIKKDLQAKYRGMKTIDEFLKGNISE